MGSYPVADTAAARILGEALRSVGYSEAGVGRLLGDEAYSADREDAPVFERRLPRTNLATLLRAFFLQLPVPVKDALAALGRRGVDALEATALAEVGNEIVPRVRILPVGKLLVASDGYVKGGEAPDYVAAYTPTSRVCDALTPRHRVARALDVGTGSGAQALLAARHARHVVATDVNPRALEFTELNAALNGFGNIECRPGSLFDPVAGETFDLITCNAPYVVSPEQRFAYRDSGLQGDEISELVVREAAGRLTDGGFAILLVSWIARDEDAPDERALAWTEATDCDSWILPVWDSDPLGHAATWNVDLAGDAEAFSSALDEWTNYLARLGVRWVTEGAIVLRRRPGRGHTVRVDEIDEDALEDAGGQVQRAFAARARLAELERAGDLLDARLAIATAMQLEHELGPRRGRTAGESAYIHLGEGTSSTVEVTPRALEIVSWLDGNASLAEAIEAASARLGLSDAQKAGLRREALDVARELLELGALEFS